MRRQLALAAAAVATFIVLAFSIPLGLLVRSIAADRALNDAERSAQTLAPVLATVRDPVSLATVVDGLNGTDVGAVTVFLADGTILGVPAEADDGVELARRGRAFSTAAAGGREVLVPVVQGDDRADVVRVLVPDERLDRGVRSAWALLAGLGVLLVLAAVALADRLARRIVGPITALATVAERLGEGDLDARVEPDGPPEVVEVGRTVNGLAGRIEGLLAAQREAVADLSHRLRTPVTALRLDAESLGDEAERQRLGADVDAMADAVDRLIADTRSSGRTGVEPAAETGVEPGVGAVPASPVEGDLAAVAAERARFWSALADDQGRPWELDLPAHPCPVAAPPAELVAVLDVLLDNVISHTPEGVGFRVAVAPGPDGAGTLVVEDDGPGFPVGRDVLARGHSAGGSSGLGLDIVRATAERAGGSVVLSASPAGGARIAVTFGFAPTAAGPTGAPAARATPGGPGRGLDADGTQPS